MKILRTPDESFEGITDFPYQPELYKYKNPRWFRTEDTSYR